MPLASDNSQERKKIAEYVVANIEKALENCWVKVYYQPVVRALTGQLCGAESLARWIDPEMGFLSPDKFIGALEESRQIHKLDCWMVKKVCSDISERIHNGLDAVPVSINFSRLDLEATDMLKVLEDAVDEYDIPRDYIHVEITESMIVSDAELMSGMIERFRSTGYEVWMDDFGSGYSSLTVLKDYHFDTLKLDMSFLRSFDDKSKAIITSTVIMAKEIDIMTLAEGVENQEQVEFLKNIGCGRLQGYYYGKPMPINDFFDHIKESKIEIEKRQWRHFYDVASFHARHTDEPLAILEDDNGVLRTLFMNDIYKIQAFGRSYDQEDIDQKVFHSNSPINSQLRKFADTVEQSKNLETFYFTVDGNILCLKGKEIAENAGSHILMSSIRNISSDTNIEKRNSLDFRLKEINHMFDTVAQINPSNNTIIPMVGKFRYMKGSSSDGMDLNTYTQKFKEEYIALADAKKFDVFCDWSTLNSRIENSSKGYVENMFRIKQSDGNYEWKGLSLMLIPGTEEQEFLMCTKPTPDDTHSILNKIQELYNREDYGLNSDDSQMYAQMWENTVTASHLKFFWKDKNRRFLGASKAFLDFYGFTIDDILGKDDEDMGWHIDGKAYRNDELDVLSKGAVVSGVPGYCIVKGIVHNIMCFKTPIYDGNEIIGLMGYFFDVDEEMARIDKLYNVKRTDTVTGFMNKKGFLDALIDYSQNYHDLGRDYALIILRDIKHARVAADYGEDFINKLLQRMGQEILKVTKDRCAVARMIQSDFALLLYTDKQSEVDELCSQLKEAIESIRELDGNKMTLKVSISAMLRSDKEATDENMYHKVLDRIQQ
ncbi:EAL domain, c-di-GMP-specific phosphodiesterase class I (or its enzymatically inactive variant) [Butyrivibrio sp. Su6]|uniref:bifunctional diguanylate cyclase/phosphodiesterase n=1 Tax=Butyrivibrio sp. Su6 TaxID=1520810 RepID=UPI00089E6AD5|nr:EAL domain-containing protein [Butyrivibrio sp. Su6]SEF64143.1 EAL domain, c-di-GMP-specific phosphodiesterase class I (or its enzymatically inactive variant) [Butyrivibrio sp. Su6]